MIALTLLLGCQLLGFAAGGRGAARSGALLALCRGVVLAHVWLSVLSLSGVRWTRPLVLLPFAASAAALAYRYFPRRRDSRVTQRLAVPIAAPDIVAGLLLLGVAALALAERITLADFFYHWGQKGEKYALHGGIDFAFLARSWNWPVHPAYPPALSELYGATALVRGAWVSAEQMLWGVGFVAFAWVGYRTLLVERLGAARGRWAALSVCAALCSATVRYRLVGGADLLLALAVALATQALARQPDPDWEGGTVAAALALSAKAEGVAFAGLLLAVLLATTRERRSRLRTALPGFLTLGAAAGSLAWFLARVVTPAGSGAAGPGALPDAARIVEVARQMLLEAAVRNRLGGLTLLVLLAPPCLLIVARALRPLAALLTLQLACFAAVYTISDVEPSAYVGGSLARIATPLLPAVLTAVFLTLASRGRTGASDDPAAGRSLRAQASLSDAPAIRAARA